MAVGPYAGGWSVCWRLFPVLLLHSQILVRFSYHACSALHVCFFLLRLIWFKLFFLSGVATTMYVYGCNLQNMVGTYFTMKVCQMNETQPKLWPTVSRHQLFNEPNMQSASRYTTTSSKQPSNIWSHSGFRYLFIFFAAYPLFPFLVYINRQKNK